MWTVGLGNRGRLSHRLSVPALGLVMRSPWTGLKYTPDVGLAGPTRLTGFDSDLRFQTVLAERWRVSVFHRFTLLKYPDPLPLTWVVHRFGVRLGVTR